MSSTEKLTEDRLDVYNNDNNEHEKNDEEYIQMLESFARQAQQNGEDLVPDGAIFAKSRRKLIHVLHSFGANVFVITLAVLDAVILICILLLEIEALKLNPGHQKNVIENARFGLECVSASIITILMIEITIKFFALGPKHFCSHWIEVVDAIVTAISLLFDGLVIANHVNHMFLHFANSEGLDSFLTAAGFIIVFRLWRIIRMLNATMISMSTGLSKKLRRLMTKQVYLQRRIYQLERQLAKHHIPIPEELEEEFQEKLAKRLHLRQHKDSAKMPEPKPKTIKKNQQI